MRCPHCGCLEDKVIDSRLSKDGDSIRRRRECMQCEHRFTTYEAVEHAEIRVIKRDGRGEQLDRNKLIGGLLKACEKRPISISAIEKSVEEIIQDLEANYPREVSSNIIGAKVMEKLHTLDAIAYVRYASVYRQFQDIGEFIDEINSMEQRLPKNAAQPESIK